MAIELSALGAIDAEAAEAMRTQPWPRPAVAWFAVSVFAVALMCAELDRGVMSMLVEPIKRDLSLSDTEMSYLLGFSAIAFYAVIGIPMARLVDTMKRNVIISIGIAIWSVMTAACGLAQNFWQLFLCRVFVGAGGTIHGPGTYSMMADYFPREKLPRAIAVLQIGYIAGGSLSLILGGAAITLVSDWADVVVPGIGVIHNWQFVFIIVGLPGLLVALLMRSVPEPARRGRMMHGVTAAMPIGDVVRYLFRHWRVYAPMFLGLAVSAIEVLGTMQWRIAFFQRTYGWSQPQAANASAPAVLIGSAIGLVFGTWLCETLARRYDDANMRAVAILYTISFPFSIAGPLMPTPWLAVLCSAVGAMCGIAGAIPQNAAVQSVTPNEMRGQVTALYLFVFTVLGGGFGPTFIAFITDHILGDESLLRYSMAGSAAIMGPLATIIMWLGVRPYGRAIAEVKERERLGEV